MIIERPDDRVLETVFLTNVNLAFPLQARKWLALLQNDLLSGIRIKPNVSRPAADMGFSFSSNGFGLRGPDKPDAGTVIFGTSFAMGMTVDNGDNWYDGLDFEDGALNLGLPVGIAEMQNLLEELHTGPRRTAIFLYHPNIWGHEVKFSTLRGKDVDAFTEFRWSLDLAQAFEKGAKIIGTMSKGKNKNLMIAEVLGQLYLLNAKYSLFDQGFVEQTYRPATKGLVDMLSAFENVLVVRLPTKEELAFSHLQHPALRDLRQNHLSGWEFFKSQVVEQLPRSEVHEGDCFELSDYQPCDTHWNRAGNARMRNLLRSLGYAA